MKRSTKFSSVNLVTLFCSSYLLLALPPLINAQTTELSNDVTTAAIIGTTLPNENQEEEDDEGNPCKSNPCGNGICKLDHENV